MIQPGELIYEGKTKRIYATNDPDLAIEYFKDDARAYHGLKRGRIIGKGELNNAISRKFFSLLAENGIPNHYVEPLDARSSVVKRCQMVPIGVKVRNRAAGSLAERLGITEGLPLQPPVIEYALRGRDLDDPLVNITHILALRLATREEMELVTDITLRVNRVISDYMREIGIEVVDFKLEFGRFHGGILVADEISPDVARFWDARTHEAMDIDRFRRNMGDVEQAYREVLRRMMGAEE